MRIVYDFPILHEYPFFNPLMEIATFFLKDDPLYILYLVEKNVKEVDKIFLEGFPQGKVEFSSSGKFRALIKGKEYRFDSEIELVGKRLKDIYPESKVYGLEKDSLYLFHGFLGEMYNLSLIYDLSLQSEKFSRICERLKLKKLENFVSNLRTRIFVKYIDRRLRNGEKGLVIHGAGHRISSMLKEYGIKVVKLRDEKEAIKRLYHSPFKWGIR